jgi:DnaJ like chaperone protein
MALGKWIGGILGFMTAGPLGALAGVVLGSVFDGMMDSVNTADNSGTYGDSAFNAKPQYDEGQRNSFLFSMLVLASYIIRSDGKVMHSEMELVRGILRQNFGASAEQQGNDILRKLFDQQKRMGAYEFQDIVRQCCGQMARNMDESQRLQMLNFLVMIAKADNKVDPSEVSALKQCAVWLGIDERNIDSMLGMGGSSLDDAYKVLGVSADATDDELRKAYRSLALKHHPDRVAALGEDVRRAAEKKFQEINDAKDRIWKARGL